MSKLMIVKEFIDFIIAYRKWWLLPIILGLLILGFLITITQLPQVAPYIYAIF